MRNVAAAVSEQMLRERYVLTKAQISDILVRATREGWAERKQGYGWRLLPVAKTPKAFEQIYRFRMLIEPAAMLEPDFRVDPKIIAELRRIQERMLESDVERLPAERLLDNGSIFHRSRPPITASRPVIVPGPPAPALCVDRRPASMPIGAPTY
ncbi:hypothetical protein [Antarcticirhabdus aurantiaca]|uniref:Uncharacterized protein n=1 Tax=Antarcticirhabdus aurantiaca TaxID=2606717 RepID=A0ACD4NQD6_9HYPH|nr:hypothetical protein [Antarcticirhabdus aurantiaca]WAJ28850.1 hypothetical protein OXU80_00945 [Jeongeuplla avenae]